MKQNGARKHRTWVVWTLMFAACKILKQPITRPKSAFYPVSKLAVETLELECFSTWHLNNVAFPLITHKWIFFTNEKASWGWLTLLFCNVCSKRISIIYVMSYPASLTVWSPTPLQFCSMLLYILSNCTFFTNFEIPEMSGQFDEILLTKI